MKKPLLLFLFLLFVVALSAQSNSRNDLTVYPNPASEFISLNDPSDVVGHIAVYNLVGKKIKEFEYQKGEQFYIADLPKGMYLVQIQDRTRKVLNTQKVNKR